MKIGLCCIVKNENRYLLEFVNHYLNLGIDTIIIYDNNDIEGEKINLIDNNNIIIKNIRGQHSMQFKAYMECYSIYKNIFDWICFFDCDEFLVLNNKYENNIKNYLSEPIFNNYDQIKINWKIYGNSDIEKITDNNFSITRFKTPVMPLFFMSNYNFPLNNHVKVIVRCIKNFNAIWYNPHFVYNISDNKTCNNKGIQCNNGPFTEFNYDNAELRHYYTKTISEYIDKLDRGWPDINRQFSIKELRKNLNLFFKYNKETEYALNLITEYINKKSNNILKIYVCSHKDFDTSVIPDRCHEIIYEKDCNNDLNNFKISYSEGYQIYEIYLNKNIQDYEYIGICHYRRYYNIDIDTLIDNLYNHDIIVISRLNLNMPLFMLYNSCFNKNDLQVIGKIINLYIPKYNEAYYKTMNLNYLYCYNMCIMKRDDFVKYCQWIFFILLKFNEYHKFNNDKDIFNYIELNKKKIPNMMSKHLDNYFTSVLYSSRINGHLMERLLNVYINKNFNNIYEIPLKFIK